MDPDVAVVIVTYNSSHVVGDLLDSLPAALDGLTADVVVVDNGSTDGTADVVEERRDAIVVRADNDGYAAGINRGVAAARPAAAALALNPDVRMAEGSIRIMLKGLERPGAGIVVPKVHEADGSLSPSLRREPSLLRNVGLNRTKLPVFSEYVADPADYTTPHVVDWALGAVMLFSRECYEAVGGWDESYFLYSEETDFCLRARDLGFATWFEPEATAIHIGKQSGYGDVTHTMLTINRVRLYRRRHGLVSSWLYFALTALIEVRWMITGARQSRAALRNLLQPSRRPAQLRASDSLMPS